MGMRFSLRALARPVVLVCLLLLPASVRADDVDDRIEAAGAALGCNLYAQAGAELRGAFDVAIAAGADVGAASQLLLRAAAAFRRGQLWADAAAALEAYGALTPPPFDARFRLLEAAQLRAFAAGNLDAHLEGDLDFDGFVDGDLDFDGVVDGALPAPGLPGVEVEVPGVGLELRTPSVDAGGAVAVAIDPRFGMDLDADGELEAFVGATLARIAALLGTSLDLPMVEALDGRIPVPEVDPSIDPSLDVDLVPDLELDLDTNLRRTRLLRGLGFGIGGFAFATGIVGLSLGLRAKNVRADFPSLSGPELDAQLALNARLVRATKWVASIGAIAAAGVVTALVLVAVRVSPELEAAFDCERAWHLVPGPGLAGLALEHRF